MRNFSEATITEAVLQRLEGAASPRMRQVSEALVRHLHAFVREVRPSQEEWAAGIAFLTETGKMCSEVRQEFILLSDTLGVSMLVDAINHPLPGGTTETTLLGPFYVEAPPEHAAGDDLSAGLPGERMIVEGTVHGPDGAPLPDAWVDTWHSDSEGFYDVQKGEGVPPKLHLRARFRTDAEGRFWFRSIVPACYPIPHDGPVGRMLEAQGRHPFRPAHVHFMAGAPGFETLVTHIFLAGDRYLDSDVVFGVKDSLVRPLQRLVGGTTPHGHRVEGPCALLRYDFTLAQSGRNE